MTQVVPIWIHEPSGIAYSASGPCHTRFAVSHSTGLLTVRPQRIHVHLSHLSQRQKDPLRQAYLDPEACKIMAFGILLGVHVMSLRVVAVGLEVEDLLAGLRD